jgi:integrase
MGEVRQRKRKYCTVCQRTATPACVEAGHAIEGTGKYCTVCQRTWTPACKVAGHAFEDTVWPTWWIRYYRNGRRYEESTHSTRKTTAQRLLKLREGDVAKGINVSPKIGQLRFEEAADDLLTDYRINGKRSYANVKATVIEGNLAPWFRGRRMAALTTADINAYVAHRQDQEAANATINRELAALKRMFTLAIRGGKLLQRPHIPMLAEHNVRKGFFERAQFESVRRHLKSSLQAVATVAYYTGWRIQSEILSLQWHQVDRSAGVLRLEPGTTKNREGRVFKYTAIEELVAVIDGLWDAHVALERAAILCPWVFQHRSWDRIAKVRRYGLPIRSFRRAWLTACIAAGCPGRVPHDFRRTAVRNLTRAGVTETVAMKVTGHKTRSVFDRYDITSEEDLADASRKLQALADSISAGTIPGTIEKFDMDALRQRLANTLQQNRLGGGEGQNRTVDTTIFSRMLYQLSYLATRAAELKS